MSYKFAYSLCEELSQLISKIDELDWASRESRERLSNALLFLNTKESNDYFDNVDDVINSMQDEISDNSQILDELRESLDDNDLISYNN